MKAFRHTGIEGGYGSLRTQNWLLGLRRSSQTWDRLTGDKTTPTRHQTSSEFGPPTKIIANPFPKGTQTTKLKALLLEYDSANDPALFGGWRNTKRLLDAGMIAEVHKPTIYLRQDGAHMPATPTNGRYRITKAGRDYVAALRAPRADRAI